jgi:hypothetical protein
MKILQINMAFYFNNLGLPCVVLSDWVWLFWIWKLQWKSWRPKMGQGLLTTCSDIIWFFLKNISFEITHNFQRTFKFKIFTLLFHSWLMSIWATNNVSWISKSTFKSDNLVGRFWIGVITFSFFSSTFQLGLANHWE